MNQSEIPLEKFTPSELVQLRHRIDSRLEMMREELLEQAAELERVVNSGKAKRGRKARQIEEHH